MANDASSGEDDDDMSETEYIVELDADEHRGESIEALKNAILGKKEKAAEVAELPGGPQRSTDEEGVIQVSEEWLEAMREELTCGLCQNLYNDPICLWCGHVMCRKCARALMESTRPQRPRCPMCRAKLRKHEDEEAATCIPLQALVKLLRQSQEIDDDDEEEDDDEVDDDDDDVDDENEVDNDVLEAVATSHTPPKGWTRLPGFRNGIVYATRNYRRSGKHMLTCLALSFAHDQKTPDDIFFGNDGQVALQFVVAQLLAEEDEYSEGLPWIISNNSGDDALIDTAAPSRSIVLAREEQHLDEVSTANGIGIFRSQTFAIDSHNWILLTWVDSSGGLEFRLAFRFFNDYDEISNEQNDDDQLDDIDEENDQYDEEDSFIASSSEEDEEKNEIDLTADDSPPPPRNLKRRRLISPVDEEDDASSNGANDQSSDSEQDDESQSDYNQNQEYHDTPPGDSRYPASRQIPSPYDSNDNDDVYYDDEDDN